jgi:uncharacterized protein YbbC (DUF1343 family)
MQWFDHTGLDWINPSPNMRSLTEASLYPGVGLLETAEVSVGRGTRTPFEFVGAPYVEENRLANALNQAALKGVRFQPLRLTPDASIYQGHSCGGVQIEVMDRAQLDPLAVGLVLARELNALYPAHFTIDKMNRLLQHPRTIAALKAGNPISQIQASWQTDLQSFRERRDHFLIYR